MMDSRTVITQLDTGFQAKCGNGKCERVDAIEYQSLIGSVMYVALSTRPDILHLVTTQHRTT